MTDPDSQIFQNSVEFLENLSQLKSLDVPAVKSFYGTKCRLMQLRNHISLASHLTSTSVKCKKCLISFKEGPAQYRVAHNKRTKFAKTLLKKVEKGKTLSKYQRKYFKRLKNEDELGITCKFCANKTNIKLNIPKEVKTVQTIPKKKKKVKKKDKFCGLNKEVIQTINLTTDSPVKQSHEVISLLENTPVQKNKINRISEQVLSKTNAPVVKKIRLNANKIQVIVTERNDDVSVETPVTPIAKKTDDSDNILTRSDAPVIFKKIKLKTVPSKIPVVVSDRNKNTKAKLENLLHSSAIKKNKGSLLQKFLDSL